MIAPVKLEPFYKDYIWGGDKLKKLYNKKTPLNIVAESWELSAHEDGSSVIADVSRKDDFGLIGMSFLEFTKRNPSAVGTLFEGKAFPVLIKLIDAKSNLSIQVHPNDAYALEHEDSYGKTEMWHILEAEQGAFLYMGFNCAVSRGELKELIESGEILSALNREPVKKGDTFFIEAGTIHAVNSGIVLAEIQQSSNVTYRVYDYGRIGTDGKPRPLHIEKALDVADMKKYQSTSTNRRMADGVRKLNSDETLADCPYFTVKSVSLDGEYLYNGTDETFASVLVTEGELQIAMDNGFLSAGKGESIFIPACKKNAAINGRANFLLTYITS